LTELLSGPTAIAFVNGEISAAAKTLRDFARTYPALIVKGGMVSGARSATRTSRSSPICRRATC